MCTLKNLHAVSSNVGNAWSPPAVLNIEFLQYVSEKSFGLSFNKTAKTISHRYVL